MGHVPDWVLSPATSHGTPTGEYSLCTAFPGSWVRDVCLPANDAAAADAFYFATAGYVCACPNEGHTATTLISCVDDDDYGLSLLYF